MRPHNAKPHLVHILGTPNFGGGKKIVLDLVTSCALSVYQHSIVFILGREGTTLQAFQKAGIHTEFCLLYQPDLQLVPSYRVNRWLRHQLTFLFPKRLASLLNELQPALVHSHIATRVELQAEAVLRRLDVPWVLTLHEMYGGQKHGLNNWKRTAALVNHSNGAVTGVGRAALDDINANVLFTPEKLAVIVNGVDLEQFNANTPPIPDWRKMFNIPMDGLLFGCLGRLAPVKRHDLFVRAATQLLATGVRAHFVIAGVGPLEEELIGLIKDLGVEDNIHLVGFQSDAATFLRQIDVFVLPSDSEAAPLALIEACAMGLPCIATEVGAVPDILSPDGGIIIPPNSTDELVQAMHTMLDKDTRERYAHRALQRRHLFSIEETARKYDELYQRILSNAQ